MNKIFIIGGGTSLNGFDYSILKNEDTITVNRSIFDVPNPNYWITMDYNNYLVNLRDDKRYEKFIFNTAQKYLIVKRTILKNYYDVTDIQHIIFASNEKYFGNDYENFAHGNNSGFCALQLAIIKRYKEIYLLGVDLCTKDGKSHYHDDYSALKSNYERWFKNFYLSIRDYQGESKIYSCSKISRLNDFIDFKNINEVLNEK